MKRNRKKLLSRRQFLKATLVAGGGLAIASCNRSTPPSMPNQGTPTPCPTRALSSPRPNQSYSHPHI